MLLTWETIGFDVEEAKGNKGNYRIEGAIICRAHIDYKIIVDNVTNAVARLACQNYENAPLHSAPSTRRRS